MAGRHRMSEIEIGFTFDYADPGSYLGTRLLDRWVHEVHETVSVVWRPLELRIPPNPPTDPRDLHWSEMTRNIEDQASKSGVSFSTPKRIPWTRKAHELALHAREKGCFEPIHRALFLAHFTEARDIGRIDVLVTIGAQHGLDAAEVRTVLGVDRFRSALEASRNEAFDRGIRGVPTLEVGGHRLEGLPSAGAFTQFLKSNLEAEKPR